MNKFSFDITKVKQKQIVIGSVVFLLFIAVLLVRYYVKDALSQENLLRTLQEKASARDSTLVLSADSLLVDTDTYSVSFWGLNLKNEPVKGETLKFDVTFKKAQIHEFALWSYLFSNKIEFSKLEIHGGKASLVPSKKVAEADSISRRERFNQGISKISKQFKRLSLDSVFVELDEIVIGDDKAQKIQKLYLAVHDFVIQQDEKAPVNLSYAAVSIETITTKASKSQYIQTIRNLNLDFASSEISIKSYHVKPKVPFVRYEKFLPFQEPWVDAEITDIDIANIDFMRLILDKELLIAHVGIEKVKLKVYKDRRLPLKASVYRKMPHEMMQELEIPAKIDTLHLKRMDIVYTENAPNGFVGVGGPGRLFFDKMELFATGLSTFTSGENKKSAKLLFGGLLNNRAPISLEIEYPFYSSNFSMKFDGKLSFCDAYLLNDLTVPSLRVKLEKGYIEELSFAGDVKNGVSKGKMGVKYQDLKISLLRPHKDDKRDILSVLGNWAISTSSTQQGVVTKRNTDFAYQRENHVGFPGFLWRSIQDGLTKVILQESAQKQLNKRSKSRK